MKIEIDTDGLVLKEVYSGVKLETAEGNWIGVCMRDDTFEININGAWHRVEGQTIHSMDYPMLDSLVNGLYPIVRIRKTIFKTIYNRIKKFNIFKK